MPKNAKKLKKIENLLEIPSEAVLAALAENYKGDGDIFARLFAGQFIYDASGGVWCCWTGHHWRRDIMEQSLIAVNSVAHVYLEERRRVHSQLASPGIDRSEIASLKKSSDDLKKRVTRLRSVRGRVDCLAFARTSQAAGAMIVEGGDFDRRDRARLLLACENGVIDLTTGELRDGRPCDYLLKASPTEYLGLDHPAPAWEKFLQEVFAGDQEMVDLMQRLIGCSIIGDVLENVLPVFWGRGRNGKSTLMEAIYEVLGELSAPIQAEMLLDQGRARSSAAPSPDIMALAGLRLAVAQESDEGRRFSPSKVKWLSGGDTLVGRHPHDKHETRFKPTHSLFLLTNNRPQAPADDFAFWERVILIEFGVSFVKREPREEFERPADPDIKTQLLAEASGILAWIVRGCLDYQAHGGLHPPQKVLDATADYRRDEDLLADFLDQCCLVGEGMEVQVKVIYGHFKEWWEENISRKAPSLKKFGKAMAYKFDKYKKNYFFYIGVDVVDDLKSGP